MNEDDLLRQQIDAIIRDEIQEVVNDYVDEGKAGEGLKGVGFVQKEDEELKVNIPQNEIDKHRATHLAWNVNLWMTYL